ncbi:MAG: VCBS repeat-containing protein [Planctomycetaceae bacterium]|nr:VCBS repeat-containing protein [Planctomycetaceae bacterium]
MFYLTDEIIPRLPRTHRRRHSSVETSTQLIESLERRALLAADVIGRAANGAVYVGQSNGVEFTNNLAGVIDPSITEDEFYADFNGDGLTDILIIRENGLDEDVLYRRLMQANGSFAPAEMLDIGTDFIDGDQQYLGIGDISGDDINDLIFMDEDGAGSTLTQRVYSISGGDELNAPQFQIQRSMIAWTFHGIADVDGDNSVEIIARSPLNGGWFRSAGNAFQPWGGWTQSYNFENVMFGDFNNDGNDDVAGRITTDGRWVVGLSNGTSRFVSQLFGGWTTNQAFTDVQIGDFNNDGNDDVFGRAANGTLVVGLSDGTDRFVTQSFGALSTTAGFDVIYVGDFNNDGFADLTTRSASEAWVVGLSDGSLFDKSVWLRWFNGTAWDLVGVGDFDELIIL